MRRLTHPTTPGARACARGHRAWLTLSMPAPASPAPDPRPGGAWSLVLPPLVVAAVAAGYLGADLAGALDEPSDAALPTLWQAALVTAQAVALLWRNRMPAAVFTAVVALDLVLLGTSDGQLGIGALAVMIGGYTLTRHRGVRAAVVWLLAAAGATAIVGTVAMLAASAPLPVLTVLVVCVARLALLYVAPAAAADYVGGRQRLARALEERADLLERERVERAARERQAERVGLARELHDIAGHHLTGIIVSAQAASALAETEPQRARQMMRAVQDDARTALADLRRTVGLLREDDDHDAGGAPSPQPAIERIPTLAEQARARGQQVEVTVRGDERRTGVLAETAAYRMVQESLANAARHAPGAACEVTVAFGADAVTIEVHNGPPAAVAVGSDSARRLPGDAYGLAGMAERAGLVGGDLTTGPTSDGGWRNRLTVPLAPVSATEAVDG